MTFRFEKLNVWQDARSFVSQVYTITRSFPTQERFALTDQLRRAAISVMLNIAEGSDRKSDMEFCRFLRIALTSVEEVVAASYIALDQKYLSQKDFDSIYKTSNLLVARLNALVTSLSKKQ